MRLYWIRASPNLSECLASLKGGKTEETLTHEKRTFEAEVRDWSDASTSQGMPRIVSNPQNLEESEKDCPSSLQRESRALPIT